MNNIRPITLQSCLGKMFNKLLAHRLGSICARHPILHPAQRGFVVGGTTVKCLDELLDAWDRSRSDKSELYTLLYDIKQAYDSVQTDVLVRALHRLQLPPAFTLLIEDSLTGLESCVRTIYGHSACFPVRRSLRQGDPLAPLLFVLLMDALHDGLDTNPFTQQQHGCRLAWPGHSVYLASLGYADDTTVLTTSLEDLSAQNRWVQYFMQFNRMRLNAAKCEVVGRKSDGTAVMAADLAAHDVSVDGVQLVPVPHSQPIRYLGAHVCFDGSWFAQFKKSLAMIAKFTRAAIKFRVSVSQAVYMFRVFLLPKLELALHYAHGKGSSDWIKNCDRLIIGCIKHLVKSPLKLSHTAVALTIGLHLPSWMEVSVKVSELFLRLNSQDARWGHIGRLSMLRDCGSVTNAASPVHHASTLSRFRRAASLAVSKLHWDLQLHHSGGRHRHLFDSEALRALDRGSCSSSPHVSLAAGESRLAHDAWSGWGADVPAQSVLVYTDGSYSAAMDNSAWSVAVGSVWLLDNFAAIPPERLLRANHVVGATLIGADIVCTQGIYPAELQAIARALAMLPLSFSLDIHSDSRSSIDAIRSYERQLNERKRMRMSARPLLQLVHNLLGRRVAAGGRVDWQHVAAQ